MKEICRLVFVVLLVATSACGGGSARPTSPSQPVGYAGHWMSSSQGNTLAFSVSAEQKVTDITTTWNVNGCAGTRTTSGLSLEIADISGVGPTLIHQSADRDATNFIGLQLTFTSPDAARGLTVVGNFAGCADGFISWAARRR